MYDAFAVIRWNAAGLDPTAISLLWSEAVAAEVVVFLLIGPALIRWLGPRGAAVLAAVAGIVRWSILAYTSSFVVLLALQPLHGLTFALLHLACMRLIAEIVPARLAATTQALYAFGPAMVTALLTWASGWIYGAQTGSFLFMAGLCALAVPIAWKGLVVGRESERRGD
jgi:PPP family 3-phenylpropionic acid transporter